VRQGVHRWEAISEEQEGTGEGDARRRIVWKQILENFCGSLPALSEFLKIFGTTYLGKGNHCLNADEWLSIMDTF
jgi:hypothetical protein